MLIKTAVLLCGSICLCLCGAFFLGKHSLQLTPQRRTHHINTNICCHITTLPFLSTLQFFINNLNILSILIIKWKQLNKERIPDDDQ